MGNENRANSEAQQNNKTKSVLITICVILAAVLVIGLTVYTRLDDSGVILRNQTAASSDNFEVSGTMMAYFYNTNYQSYASYLSYLGVDTSASLKTQPCSYIESGTWFDYFVAVTQDYVNELLAICEAANKAGVTIDDVDQTDIETTLTSLEEIADSYGYSVNQYLTLAMGVGMNENDVRKCLELSALATHYSNQYHDSLSYTDEEKEAYYSEHTADFDGVDYLVFSTAAADFMTKDSSGNPIGETTEASAAAKAEAEKLAAAASEDEFLSLAREYLSANTDSDEETIDVSIDSCFQRHVVASSIAAISDWAFSASAGDTHMTGADGDTTFAVYYLVKPAYRDETVNRNVRHILFSSDEYEDSTKAEEVFAEWEAAGFTDEKFNELVTTYSADEGSVLNGGRYENVAQGEMTNHFNAWLFDANRKVNDREIVESDYGWHIMEYLGDGEGTAWEANAENALNNERYTEMITENSASITFNLDVINKINA